MSVSVSLETIKKGGSMGGFFGNHGFCQGKQGPKGQRPKISKVRISDWEVQIQGYPEGRKPKPAIDTLSIADWEILIRDLTEALSFEKNTVVMGDFSYGY